MKKISLILIVVSLIIIPLSGLSIINTAVSLKYETENPSDCISLTSGQNLCLIKYVSIIIFLTAIATLIFCSYYLMFWKKK
jgi:hypothetical protein